ncbi:Oligosaccharide translocation protein rft1 [Malassezia sp. CBS 17886]|nr:Oligosaccharide translocation protein rft1 [Malassezia sp. CBS 17886]
MPPHDAGAERVASSAHALLLLQVSVRLVTFALNQVLVRTTSPAVFGAANVQLELVLATVLTLAREGVRAVVMRRRGAGMDAGVHNLALLPAAAGGGIAAAVGGAYAWWAPAALRAHGAAFSLSVALYCMGAFLELLAEPLHTRALFLPAYVRIRMAMEASAVVVRAVVAVALLEPSGMRWLARVLPFAASAPARALVAFGLSRAAYGAAVFLVGAVAVARATSVRDVFAAYMPQWSTRGDAETYALLRVTSAQAVLKLVLTEGDKIAVVHYTTLEEQGGYALASNYGSLVARTFFQPVEETTLIRLLLRLHILLGLFLVTFAPPLAQPFLYVAAGPRWALGSASTPATPSTASSILAWYCYYVPVMGINGVVEAFVQSVLPPRTLAYYSRVLIASSVLFAALLALGHAAYASPTYGAALERGTGAGAECVLVVANIISLGVRAAVSWSLTASYFARRVPPHAALRADTLSLRACSPSLAVWAAFAAAFAAVRTRRVVVADVRGVRGVVDAIFDTATPLARLVAVTAVATLGTFLVCLWTERGTAVAGWRMVRGRGTREG